MKKTTETSKRRINKLPLIGGCLIALLATGGASAEWKVDDRKAREHLDSIKKQIGGSSSETVSGRLVKIHNQQQIKGDKYNPEASEESKSKMAEAPDFDQQATIKDRRCGNDKTPADQKAVCEAIVKLEEDRYKYLQDVRKLSTKRSEELRKIYQERANIGVDEAGKLQSNTNRLLMLLTQQRIDELNLQMAMNTFDERLRERQEQQNYLAETALDPTKKKSTGFDLGPILSGATQVATLHAALEVARSRDR